jgi:hypothetical protein
MGTPTMHHQQHIEAALKAEFGTLHYAPEEENTKKQGRRKPSPSLRGTVRIFLFLLAFMICFAALPIDL